MTDEKYPQNPIGSDILNTPYGPMKEQEIAFILSKILSAEDTDNLLLKNEVSSMQELVHKQLDEQKLLDAEEKEKQHIKNNGIYLSQVYFEVANYTENIFPNIFLNWDTEEGIFAVDDNYDELCYFMDEISFHDLFYENEGIHDFIAAHMNHLATSDIDYVQNFVLKLQELTIGFITERVNILAARSYSPTFQDRLENTDIRNLSEKISSALFFVIFEFNWNKVRK